MTVQIQQATHTYPLDGTPAEVRSGVAALRRAGQLVERSGPVSLGNGFCRVQVTVWAYPVPSRLLPRGEKVWRWVLVYAGALPFLAAGGYVAGRLGAEVIGQLLVALGSFAVAAFLLYALVSVLNRGHHCPGCPDH